MKGVFTGDEGPSFDAIALPIAAPTPAAQTDDSKAPSSDVDHEPVPSDVTPGQLTPTVVPSMELSLSPSSFINYSEPPELDTPSPSPRPFPVIVIHDGENNTYAEDDLKTPTAASRSSDSHPTHRGRVPSGGIKRRW